MRTADLFAGIGGFSLGLERAGHRTVLLCENDPAAIRVLTRQFPHTRLQTDVRALRRLPAGTELVTAGFPCQNVSAPGDKTGIAGKKTGVVRELIRLVKDCRPETVVVENVRFILELRGGEGIRYLAEELERLGYAWAYRTVDVLGLGVPQHRARVFLCAMRNGDPRTVLLHDAGERRRAAPPAAAGISASTPWGFYWTEGRAGLGLTKNALPTLKSGSGLGIPSAPAVLLPDGRVVTPPISGCERVQGFPAGWTAAAEDAGGEGARRRLVGNALPPEAAEWIGRRLANRRRYDPNGDEPLTPNGRWPPAAWNLDRRAETRHACEAGDQPAEGRLGDLAALRPETWPELSTRALTGFLKRAGQGSLRFPEGFLERLEARLRARTGKGKNR